MNGLPEPMAPVVPDLHVAPSFNTTRTAQPNTNTVPAQQPSAVLAAAAPDTGGGAEFTQRPQQQRPAAQTPHPGHQPQKPAQPADVEMKDASRPSMNMPSLEAVSSALSGIELAKQIPTDPEEVNKRFMALMARNPLSADKLKAIDNTMLWLNCPPPLIRPRTPEKRRRTRYTLTAYSAHAPPIATRIVSQNKQTVLEHPLSGANIKRYLRMGKPPNPHFTYHPPSRPASRATSAGAAIHRSRSPPVVVKNVATGGAEALADTTADEHPTVRKRCGCCMQDSDFKTGMSKLRYCPRCEKMRWQLRQNGGGRVQHLRDAIQELGQNASVQDVVRLAAKKAQVSEKASEKAAPPAPAAAATPAARMTLAQGPTVESLAQNEETDGRASGSGAEADQPESQGKSNRPEKPVKAERVPPALNSSRSTEEIDNMAALLAGKSLDKDPPKEPPQKRAAVVVQKDCDICKQPFAWKSDVSSSCCEYCEQLKARTKSAGYTTSELRKGIATGFIFPQALPSTEDIRRLLGNMMLGRPRDAAPQGRGGRRPARDRSTPTPTPTPTSDSKPSDVGVLGSSRDGSEQQNTQAVAGPGDTTTNADLIREVKEVILPPFSVGMDTS